MDINILSTLTLEAIDRTSLAGVLTAVRSFASSSAGRYDALRPQHLKDLLAPYLGEVSERLGVALARVVDPLQWGSICEEVRPMVFAACLYALPKKMPISGLSSSPWYFDLQLQRL